MLCRCSSVSRPADEKRATAGLDGAIRAMAEENPDWIAVLVETQARLRHDPPFQARADASSDETSTQIVAWFRARQEDGTFRDDLDALELARFAAMTLNGLALRVVSGNPTDVDALLRLLHDALAPRK